MPLPSPHRPGRPTPGEPPRRPTTPAPPVSNPYDEEETFSSVAGPASYLDDDEEELLLQARQALSTPSPAPSGASKFDAFDEEDGDEEVEGPPPAHPRTTVKRREPLAPLREEPEDDEEAYPEDEESSEEDEVVPEEEPKGLGRKAKPVKAGKPRRRGFRGAKDPSEGLPQGETQDTFVDKKKGKLLPFGTGRTAKVSEFDKRNNLETKRNVVAFTLIGLMGLTAAMGVKNAFFPAEQLSQDEVRAIASADRGETGFPLEKGQGFATDFMKAYLTINNTPVADRMLSYYYSGSLKGEGGSSSESRIVGSDFKQDILYGPTVYATKALSPTSASYTIGAVVQPAAKDSVPPADGSAAQVSFFNVNVYYDKATDSFMITPESPTVVPATTIGDKTKLPAASPVGTGETSDELNKAVESVVLGYVKGYATSTPLEHTALDQYITKVDDPSLVKGMGGRYTLQGDNSEAISFEAYSTDDPTTVKAVVKVKWVDAVSPTTNVGYVSHYVMTLFKQDNGKYLVAKFAPQYYVASAK